jgi:hypothetical protein
VPPIDRPTRGPGRIKGKYKQCSVVCFCVSGHVAKAGAIFFFEGNWTKMRCVFFQANTFTRELIPGRPLCPVYC